MGIHKRDSTFTNDSIPSGIKCRKEIHECNVEQLPIKIGNKWTVQEMHMKNIGRKPKPRKEQHNNVMLLSSHFAKLKYCHPPVKCTLILLSRVRGGLIPKQKLSRGKPLSNRFEMKPKRFQAELFPARIKVGEVRVTCAGFWTKDGWAFQSKVEASGKPETSLQNLKADTQRPSSPIRERAKTCQKTVRSVFRFRGMGARSEPRSFEVWTYLMIS